MTTFNYSCERCGKKVTLSAREKRETRERIVCDNCGPIYTQGNRQFFDSNRVPAEPIVAVVNNFLNTNGTRMSDGTFKPHSIRLLAEQADVHEDTLQKILSGRGNTIDFDFADKLLCVMNMNDLWHSELVDVYENANLAEEARHYVNQSSSGSRVCARKGCSNSFVPPHRYPRKRFCSDTCRKVAWFHNTHGLKTVPRGKGRRLEELVCRNGHERTKENTAISTGGKRYCRICHNVAVSAWRKEHPRKNRAANA